MLAGISAEVQRSDLACHMGATVLLSATPAQIPCSSCFAMRSGYAAKDSNMRSVSDQVYRRFSRRQMLGGAAATSSMLLKPPVSGAQTPEAESLSGEYAQAVVTTHHEATAAGIATLQAGGSAADASVAIAAALSVVEPYFSHALGGGTWALYYDQPSGKITAVDGVGPVGSKASLEDYSVRAGTGGIHQSIVPGAWDGWMLWLLNYGRLGLRQILQPAIDLATNGFAVSAEMSSYMSRYYDSMLAHQPTASVYAPNGSFPQAGDWMTMSDLAATFTGIADAYDSAEDHTTGIQAARDYVYRGPIAEAMVAESDSGNGYLTRDDFHTFEASIVEPISIAYGASHRVYQNPPNSQGITMLLGLNILKHFDHTGLGVMDVDTVHSQVEAIKLAFGDRNAFIGDPAQIEMDLEWLLSDEHAAEQAERIDMANALPWPENAAVTAFEPANTTTFQVTDSDGNAASATTSIGLQFRVIGTTGIHINNRMTFLSLDPSSPNVVAPGKKVRHTSCPYMVLRDGSPYLIGGNTGADSQPQVQLQQLMSAIDFGLSPQEAISLPRWISRAFVPSTYPHEVANTLQLQPEHASSVVEGLAQRGHATEIGGINLGNGGMIRLSQERTVADVGAESRFSTAYGEVIG